MQVVIGHSDIIGDEEFKLLSHGGPGGKCSRWVLQNHDFVTEIRYTYDATTDYLTKVRFKTRLEQERTIGRGSGPSISYYFTEEKQFLGFYSYEIDDETFAFGAFDSVCNHLGQTVESYDNQVAESSTPSEAEEKFDSHLPEGVAELLDQLNWEMEAVVANVNDEGYFFDEAIEAPQPEEHIVTPVSESDVEIILPSEEFLKELLPSKEAAEIETSTEPETLEVEPASPGAKALTQAEQESTVAALEAQISELQESLA